MACMNANNNELEERRKMMLGEEARMLWVGVSTGRVPAPWVPARGGSFRPGVAGTPRSLLDKGQSLCVYMQMTFCPQEGWQRETSAPGIET